MRKVNKHSLILFFFLIVYIFSACGQGDIAASPRTPSPSITDQALPLPTGAPAESITPETSISLSVQPYTSPSGAFEIYFPQDWNCSESGMYRVDCQSPDNHAAISVRAVNTGYELSQPMLESLASAEMVYEYAEKKAYMELSRESADGVISINAEWRAGEDTWQSEDRFIRQGAAVYHLAFSALQMEWESYAGLFQLVRGKAVFQPGAMLNGPVYGLKRKYTAPDVLFTLEIPTSWMKFADTAKIAQTQIEGFLAPDLHAAVQIAVYRQGAIIEQDFKAVKTLEILRALYGANFRVSHDKALPDGRERLAWAVENKGLSGISYFDSWGSSLYIFTVLWDDPFEYLYLPVLEKVMESFGYE